MLRKIQRKKNRARGGNFVIVASRYNSEYVDAMALAAENELKRAGAKIQIVRVPGAFEIPVVAAKLADANSKFKTRNSKISAIICLGVILRGESVHAAHIGEAVSRALMKIQIETGIPVIHEVLLLENEAQAQKRCLDKNHNRGTEAAQTALEMARVMKNLPAIKF
jgi:6,7-dimethyl-8-ribityllumazine synthase